MKPTTRRKSAKKATRATAFVRIVERRAVGKAKNLSFLDAMKSGEATERDVREFIAEKQSCGTAEGWITTARRYGYLGGVPKAHVGRSVRTPAMQKRVTQKQSEIAELEREMQAFMRRVQLLKARA
jgi:hypothetical protein